MRPAISHWSSPEVVKLSFEQTRDLAFEFLSGDGVHTTPRAFKTTIPSCKRLAIAKCGPNATSTDTVKTLLPIACGHRNQAGRAPVA